MLRNITEEELNIYRDKIIKRIYYIKNFLDNVKSPVPGTRVRMPSNNKRTRLLNRGVSCPRIVL